MPKRTYSDLENLILIVNQSLLTEGLSIRSTPALAVKDPSHLVYWLTEGHNSQHIIVDILFGRWPWNRHAVTFKIRSWYEDGEGYEQFRYRNDLTMDNRKVNSDLVRSAVIGAYYAFMH